jgi:hypothetical protein
VKGKASAQKPTGYGYTPGLRGPKGQELSYKRLGSYRGPADPSLPSEGALLDMYQVTYDGLEKPVTLYLDMYRHEDPRVPAGFRLA